MSQHLPLVAAQPGIWMAEKLSELPSAWSVAHYVELTGEVDSPLLARAVVAGLAQADTLRMRFTEDNGEVWQWVDDALTFELPEIIDLRTNIDPHGTAQALMQADLQQDLRVDSAWVAGVSVVLWGLGASLGFPLTISAASDTGPDAPTRVSVVATTGYLAFLVGPPLLGYLGEHYGLRSAMLVVLALVILAAIVAKAVAKPDTKTQTAMENS